jgi:long-chain acyl-CoA synthetase
MASYPDAARNFDDTSVQARHLAEVVRLAANEYGARPAVSTQLPNGACATLSFAEIDRLTDDFATYLRETAGVRAGDVIAQMSPNCIDFLIVTFGVFKAGCICTNINPLYTTREMEHQLRDSKAKVLVVMEQFGDKVDAISGHTEVRQVVTTSVLDFFPPLKKAFMGFVLRKIKKMVPPMSTPHTAMTDALRDGARRRRGASIDVDAYRAGQATDDTALYQYTGGTTGRSKGAELSHRNILLNGAAGPSMIIDEVGARDDDCVLVVLPLYHITAFALVMLPGVQRGQHCIMVPSPRPPSNLRAAFENHAITHFTGINTLYAALLQEPWCTSEVLGHLRFCGSGGAAQHVALAERWEALTGVPIHQGYGLTECGGVLTMNPAGRNRLGSAGLPIPDTAVKIVDSQGLEVPPGEVGEIIARGPTVMKGYLDQPEATAITLKDGWLHTGDLGMMDEDGYVQVVDRKKDMILVSGFNVYPNEIEDVIAELEGVVEVGVIGVPDEKTEEAVKAFVVSSDPDMTAEQVIAHCKASLTNYKRPKQVEFVKEIPKTPVGKVLRRNLREMNAK